MTYRPLMGALALSGVLASAPALAVDGFTLNAGSSDGGIDFYRIGALIDWDQRWLEGGDWFLGGHFEIGLNYMDGDTSVANTIGAADDLMGISFTPVFRFQRQPYGNSIAPFVEYGLGAAYLSEDKIRNEAATGKDLGGNFHFENKLSAGIRFGENQQFETSVNYFHYSNAGLEDPNDGLDIYSATFSYWY